MRNLLSLLGPLALIAASFAACSSAPRSIGQEAAKPDGGVGAGEFAENTTPEKPTYSSEEIWADDPPPKWCGPANGGKKPPAPGGTPECPDDKNREGCPCTKLGETKPCWPGLRVNRNLGDCKDGTTTCVSDGELSKKWGKCEDFVLPDKNAEKGAAACKCFSAGSWKLDNVIPCFISGSSASYATSAECKEPVPPNTKPATPWSENTLKVDCAGHFKLCYSLKAGDAKNPKASDCSLMTVCTEDDYVTAGTEQAFPKLPGWVSNDAACVDKILAGSPIYGEMTVEGESVLCDDISDSGKPLVFNRVAYCPMDCAERPNDTDCKNCGNGGSGSF